MIEAGFYEREITPPLGSGLPGYFNIRRADDVKDRLFARAVILKNETESLAVVSVDGLMPMKEIVDSIYESRSGSNCLDKEAGYIMAEKLISMEK